METTATVTTTTTTAQSPPNDSFSYAWLANFSPSLSEIGPFISPGATDSSGHVLPDETAAASFIEMDPRLPPSKRFSTAPPDLCFDFPVTGSPLPLVHADELISNGFLLPLVPKRSRFDDAVGDCNNDDGDSNSKDNCSPAVGSVSISSEKRDRCGSLSRCRRLSVRFLARCFRCLVRRFFRCGRDFRSEEDDRSGHDVRMRWELYGAAAVSPRASLAWSSADDDWRRSCDSESSIYEAVLHCKRTQGI